jgi:hypothetical protein
MLKMGVPAPAVEQKMRAEGLSDDEIKQVGTPRATGVAPVPESAVSRARRQSVVAQSVSHERADRGERWPEYAAAAVAQAVCAGLCRLGAMECLTVECSVSHASAVRRAGAGGGGGGARG